LAIAFAILRTFDSSAYVDPHTFTIGTRLFSVQVAPDCSGYEGIGLVVVFVAIQLWLWRARLRFPRAFLLLPIGMVAVWLANAIRIAALVEVGAHWSPDIAVGGFHSYGGVLLFIAVALGTTAAAHRSTFFDTSVNPSGALGANPAAPWLVPFLAILVTGFVTGLFTSGGFDRLYLVRVAVGGVALWWYRREYRRFDWHPSVASIAAGVLVFAFWLLLARLIGDGQAAPTVSSHTLGPLWLTLRVIGSVLIVPMAEELAFRGYLARRLMSADFESVSFRNLSAFSILVSSGAFAALHGRMMIPAFLAGLAYAGAARIRGRIADAVLAHVLTNALLSAHAILSGNSVAWN
jgi:exosortase E/protease (VPEID-CTERM system)